MEDLHELSRELVRDILNLAEDVEAVPAHPQHVSSKAELKLFSHFAMQRLKIKGKVGPASPNVETAC